MNVSSRNIPSLYWSGTAARDGAHSSIHPSRALSRHLASRAPRATTDRPPPFRIDKKRSYVGFKMRCAARVATRCADGQLDGGWVDEDAPGMVLAAALAQRHCTACLVSGRRRGDEACNAWLHHACLRTKGRMVSTHNHEIASLRPSRGGGAALTPSPTTCILRTSVCLRHTTQLYIWFL